jgi:hypothetical protein
MTKIKKHLTWANAISTLAVFLLLGGGSALAAKKQTQKIGTTQIKSAAITTAKIKNEAVDATKIKAGAVSEAKLGDGAVSNQKLLDGAVTNSKLAPDSVSGEKVNEATLSEVPAAASANPAVFAHVEANGVIDAANSKGLTSVNVSHPATGVYCIAVPSFAPRGGQVTIQAGGAGGTTAQIAVGGGSCPGAVQVSTWSAAAAAANVGFFVELYR